MRTARFSVDIETWGAPPTADALAALGDALTHQGARGVVTSAGGLAGGVGATIGVELKANRATLDEAAKVAMEVFDRACADAGIEHEDLARVDVMTDAYLERWLTREPERYAGVSEVAALLGVSRQRVAQLRARPDFPTPIAELAAGPVWKVSSLQRFLEAWERRPGRPRKAETA